MSKRFNPVDYNLSANPELRKTNSPWWVWQALFVTAAVCLGAWLLFPPAITVSQPWVEFSVGNATVITTVENHGSEPVEVTLRVSLGRKTSSSKSGSGRFLVIQESRYPSASWAACG